MPNQIEPTSKFVLMRASSVEVLEARLEMQIANTTLLDHYFGYCSPLTTGTTKGTRQIQQP